MKKSDILDSIEYVDAQLINEAEKYAPKKKNSFILKWCAAAACLCLVFAGAFGVTEYYGYLGEQTGKQQAGSINSGEGVCIPPVELPEKTDGETFDMIALVVYNGGIYTEAESYTGEVARRIDSLTGEYLGYASGSIDEWSKPEEYGQDFASSVAGKVYDVKGYDTDFRICIREETVDENGEATLWIQYLDRLNGITLNSGEDLFEDRLHIRGRVENIQWQSHEDWNSEEGNYQNANLDPAVWEEFLGQIDKNKFLYAWNPDSAFYSGVPDSTIYDTQNQAFLYLNMTDGTVIGLRLIEGGYVGYDSLGWYFVQIPVDAFNAVYDACGGTHIE